MNMIISKLDNLFVLLVSLTIVSSIAFAGTSSGGGGGDPKKIMATEIKLLINGRGLKNAMLKYLETIKLDQVQEKDIKAIFSAVMARNALQEDINSKTNYTVEESCADLNNAEVPASTEIGVPGSDICFNVNAIAEEYQNLDSENVMIRLASLAMHEHIHHFQSASSGLTDNEDQAYRVSAYMQTTAKVMQMPVLKWSLAGVDPVVQVGPLLETGSYIYSDTSDACGAGIWTSPDKSIIKLTNITNPKTLTACPSAGLIIVYRKDSDGIYRQRDESTNEKYRYSLNIYDKRHFATWSQYRNTPVFLEYFSAGLPDKPTSFFASGSFQMQTGSLDDTCGIARTKALQEAKNSCLKVYGNPHCTRYDSYIVESGLDQGPHCIVELTVRP